MCRNRHPNCSRTRATLHRSVALALLTLVAVGCGQPRHVLRPPDNVALTAIDSTPPAPPPPPPVPDHQRAFDTDWLYLVHPRTHALRDEPYFDVASNGRILNLGPVPLPPPVTPATATPTDPAAESPSAPAVGPAAPTAPTDMAPPVAPALRPTTTTARLIVLPGFPGDNFDRNINGVSTLGLSMGTLYGQLFGNRQFADFEAKPVVPPPAGLAQVWTVAAVNDQGRAFGFIARSGNLAAWSFCLCEPSADAQVLRDTLLSQLRLRLGQEQRFNADLTTDFRIETAIPAGWRVPGPSPLSRRWDAPDQMGFIILSHGEARGASVFRTCTADDALQALRDFPPVKEHLAAGPLQIDAVDRFLTEFWAACGQAETILATVPRATTVGVHLFYDPVARKKFSVYYGYQTEQRKREIQAMLGALTRTAQTP